MGPGIPGAANDGFGGSPEESAVGMHGAVLLQQTRSLGAAPLLAVELTQLKRDAEHPGLLTAQALQLPKGRIRLICRSQAAGPEVSRTRLGRLSREHSVDKLPCAPDLALLQVRGGQREMIGRRCLRRWERRKQPGCLGVLAPVHRQSRELPDDLRIIRPVLLRGQ